MNLLRDTKHEIISQLHSEGVSAEHDDTGNTWNGKGPATKVAPQAESSQAGPLSQWDPRPLSQWEAGPLSQWAMNLFAPCLHQARP